MPLLYLPYVPSRFGVLLLEGRNIRADVHEWLAARLPKGSRLTWDGHPPGTLCTAAVVGSIHITTTR